MSNVLNIDVGKFRTLTESEGASVTVSVSDTYVHLFGMTFDDVDHLLTMYPTKEELVRAVLKLPAFEDTVVWDKDGNYTLDLITDINVKGFPGE